MNRETIYIRTEKGERAAADPHELPPGLEKILGVIDGKASVEALLGRLDKDTAGLVELGLAALVEGDFIHDASGSTSGHASSSVPADENARKAQELRDKIRDRRKGGDRSRSSPAIDAWYKARREADERASREAEDQARRSAAEEPAKRAAEEQARRDAEERIRRETEERIRRETEERIRRETEERIRRETEERVRRETEERIRRETEERVRWETEERVRRETEEKARRDAEEQTRRNAEEQARRDAEEKARRDAEEQERRGAGEAAEREAAERARQEAEEEERQIAEEVAWRKAEEEARRQAAAQAPQDAGERAEDEEAERARLRSEAQVRLLAEEQAWLEAEEKIRREEEAATGKLEAGAGATQGGKAGSRRPHKWGKLVAGGLVAMLVAGLVGLHLISFDEQIPQFEKVAAAQFQQPVKIKALHLSLLPLPHLRLEGVSIGSEGQIRVPRISATGEIGNLSSERKVFKSVELDSPVFTEEGLGWILFGKSPMRDVMFGQVSALNATLESKNISLSAFDAKLQADGEGGWKTIAVESVDKNFSLELIPKGQSIQIEAKAKTFKIPFGSTLALDELVAIGMADRAGLAVSEFKGFIYGGTLSGTARLKWGANWSLAGDLNAKQIDTTKLVPELLTGGRLAGAASYAMQAPQSAKLFSEPHMEGSFTIPWGTLLGVDLGRMLQGGERRGETKFTELSGSFVHDRGATQLRPLRLSQATMSASGNADVDADNNVRGRFAADLKLSTELRRANLGVSGTVGKLEWLRF